MGDNPVCPPYPSQYSYPSMFHRSKDGKGEAKGKARDVTPDKYSHVFPLLLSLQVNCGLERPNSGRLAPERENSMNHSGHLAKQRVGVPRGAPQSQTDRSGRAEGGPTGAYQRVGVPRGAPPNQNCTAEGYI